MKPSLTCLVSLYLLAIAHPGYISLLASLGFNLGHTSNLPHQLDCDLPVGRGYTFYFVIYSLATGQSTPSVHVELAASEQDLSLSILIATQSQLRPIVHMNGKVL